MTTALQIEIVDGVDRTWPERVEIVQNLLGAPANPYLFPPHFLQRVFPEIGGRCILLKRGASVKGVGFLFPRGLRNQRREYTLRLHIVDSSAEINLVALLAQLKALMPKADLVIYLPEQDHRYSKTSTHFEGFEIGRPDEHEAEAIRDLQQRIWGFNSAAGRGFLYPADIHSADFRPGTSLVVRKNSAVIAFLFGFYRFNGPVIPESLAVQIRTDLRIESQLMGVTPSFRGFHLGYVLKKIQANLAQQDGIDLIHWTFDPLQFRNAVLNFAELGAVTFHFYPDYYPFRNELNRVAPSRFEATWLIRSRRVTRALTRYRKEILDLKRSPEIKVVNKGIETFHQGSDAGKIAIEIPADWTNLQATQLSLARAWREHTDHIFSHYLGTEEGKYAAVAVGRSGQKCYLIAERITSKFLSSLR